jgi:hypothetical protein
MRKIEPITIWKNGESQEANLLNAIIINDNLATSCSFYYSAKCKWRRNRGNAFWLSAKRLQRET